ncbi:MAG: PKD domain-containing protein [Bacteroidetes bacterium]|nr:PKD domain-containing protein [Bacteroidota bacterium]
MKTKQLFQSLLLATGILSAQFLHAQNPCQAGFTFSVTNNVVTFTNTSTGANMPSYSWNFGDGNYDWQANPIHTYMYNGTYMVCLTMWDSLPPYCQSTYCDTVVITNAPPAPCSANFSYVFQGNTFYFSDASTGGPFILWNWNFGDGNNSSLQNPSHMYANAGTYTVCLTVVSQTDTCSYCDTIGYYPCNAQASFTFNSANDPTVSFTSTCSGASNPYYSWNFGDGSYSSSPNPIHIYSYSGTYIVCLSYGDTLNQNCSAYFCDTIVITNAPPPPPPPVLPCDSSFTMYPDTSGSGWVWFYSNGNNNVSCSWDFGDGNFGTGCSQVAHQYSVTGWYNVCLTVITANGDTCSNCDSVYVLRTGSGIHEQDGNVFGIKNYPNPFSNSTTIFYSLKEKADVNISVFNHVGMKVVELENRNKEAGAHQLEWNAENLTSGVYFLEIRSGGNVLSRKMILIK